MLNKNFSKIIITLLLILSFQKAYSMCYGYNGACQTDCYVIQSYSEVLQEGAKTCHYRSQTSTYMLDDFYVIEKNCDVNQQGLMCYQVSNSQTAYIGNDGTTDCSSCTGTLSCGSCDANLIGSNSDCDNAVPCYEGWQGISWVCKTSSSYSACSDLTTKSNCESKSCAGCSWQDKIKYSLSNKKEGYTTSSACEFYIDKCPSNLVLNPNNNYCVTPLCKTDNDCVVKNGAGFICENAGAYNSLCVPKPGFQFGATYYKTLNNVYYKFFLRTDVNQNAFLDISKREQSDFDLVYYGLKANEQFILDNTAYTSVFGLPPVSTAYEFALYTSDMTNRLTYNIFPVCGNGVCETCESEDNCLHYPPESCMSCPTDCPYVSNQDLLTYNQQMIESGSDTLSFSDLSNNADNGCKVKTLDSNSICNPLCVSHDFIDELGCIFNQYSNALPTDEYEQNTYEKNLTYNEQNYTVYFSNDDTQFYGESNSLCTHGCECIYGNCAGPTDDKHCCQTGYTWGYTDPKNEYCYDGKLKATYREAFENYNEYGKIKSTVVLGLDGGQVTAQGGSNANEYICLDNSDVTVYAQNKTSCVYGYDPFCVYGNPDNFEVVAIKQEGIGQCRNIEESTPEVITQLTCTIHSHAWAYAGCEEDAWYGCKGQTFDAIPYNNYFCVTDNTFECSSYYSVRDTLGESGPVLTSITYDEFCHNPELVCSGSTYVTNEQLGGMLQYVNCPQDGYTAYDESWLTDLMVLSSTYANSIKIPIGYYCSLFGNDYDYIFGIDRGNQYGLTDNKYDGTESYDLTKYTTLTSTSSYSSSASFFYSSYEDEVDLGDWGFTENGIQYIRASHLPRIDRDAEERLYHLLWNYESCKEIYPDLTFTCESYEDDSSSLVSWTQDDAVESYPVNHFLGSYNYPQTTDNYIVSRTFCEELWDKYDERMGVEYDWKNPNLPNSLSLNISGTVTTYGKTDLENYIRYSCLYWYNPFLNVYYSEQDALNTGIEINPPIVQWGIQVSSTYTNPSPSGGVSTSTTITSYEPLNLNYFRNQDYCSDTSGTIISGEKCSSYYPFTINSDSRTCDCDAENPPIGCK